MPPYVFTLATLLLPYYTPHYFIIAAIAVAISFSLRCFDTRRRALLLRHDVADAITSYAVDGAFDGYSHAVDAVMMRYVYATYFDIISC